MGREGKKLLENVKEMNEIRNFYAHHLDTEIIPEKVRNKIDKMHLLAKRECEEYDNFIDKYRCKVLSTFAGLEKLSGEKKNELEYNNPGQNNGIDSGNDNLFALFPGQDPVDTSQQRRKDEAEQNKEMHWDEIRTRGQG